MSVSTSAIISVAILLINMLAGVVATNPKFYDWVYLGTFNDAPNYPDGVYGHNMWSDPQNNYIYAQGGFDDQYNYDLKRYTPGATPDTPGSWDSLNADRSKTTVERRNNKRTLCSDDNDGYAGEEADDTSFMYNIPTAPGWRANSATWVHNSKLWLFGGSTFPCGNTNWNNDVWSYTFPSTWTLEFRDTDNYDPAVDPAPPAAPSARQGMIQWVGVNGELYIYGGSGINGTNHDVWSFNTNSKTWTLRSTGGWVHPPAIGSVAWSTGDGYTWVFGGSNDDSSSSNDDSSNSSNDIDVTITNEVYRYTEYTNSWDAVLVTGTKPTARKNMVGWAGGSNFYFYGGDDGADSSELWSFSWVSSSWTLVRSGESAVEGAGLAGYMGPIQKAKGVMALNCYVYIFGGTTDGDEGSNLWVSALPDCVVCPTGYTKLPHTNICSLRPTVTHIAEVKKPKRSVGAGSSSVWVGISGVNFQFPYPGVSITATVGGFPCINVHHISDTYFECLLKGTGTNLAVVVTVNTLSSLIPNTTGAASSVRFDFPIDTITSGLACVPPHGSVDALVSEACNCWSGYAPEDPESGVECNKRAVCAGNTMSVASVAMYSPLRPSTYFADDRLYLKQVAPIVQGRRDTIIQFVVPNIPNPKPVLLAGSLTPSTCSYPGTLWSKKVNDLDCLDEWYGELPWSQHELCGFVEDLDNNAEFRIFRSVLVSTYTDTFKKHDGTLAFRTSANSYALTVTFRRRVIAITNPVVDVIIADPTATQSAVAEVVSSTLYDVESKTTMFTIMTTFVWPYEVNATAIWGEWSQAADNTEAGVAVTTTITKTAGGVCTKEQDTECEQTWEVRLASADACNIAGTVEFDSGVLLCRDYTITGDCADAPSRNVSIKFSKTDLCNSNTKDLDASAGIAATLTTYYDRALELPQSTFQTGDLVFFHLALVDPESSIDTIKFNSISVANGAGTTALLFDANAILAAGTNTQLNVTQEFAGLLQPKSIGDLTFEFRLLRDKLTPVSVLLPDAMQQLTVTVVVDVFYHGNNKRTLEFNKPYASSSYAHFNVYPGDDEVVDESGKTVAEVEAQQDEVFTLFENSAASSFMSVALTVCGIIALFL